MRLLNCLVKRAVLWALIILISINGCDDTSPTGPDGGTEVEQPEAGQVEGGETSAGEVASGDQEVQQVCLVSNEVPISSVPSQLSIFDEDLEIATVSWKTDPLQVRQLNLQGELLPLEQDEAPNMTLLFACHQSDFPLPDDRELLLPPLLIQATLDDLPADQYQLTWRRPAQLSWSAEGLLQTCSTELVC